ncbi:MAG: DUF2147 domain-containing protein [Hyphomicrobium sp.]
MGMLLKVCLAAAAMVAGTGAWAAEGPLGIWYDHTGRGAVEITDCNGALCGKVVWLQDQKNAKAAACRSSATSSRWAMAPSMRAGSTTPDKDAKFDVELVPQGDKMKVVGYAGVKFLSQTFVWTRAPDNLQRCTS